MGMFSAEKLFGMTIRESATDGSDFTNPDADYRRLFLGEDGLLHLKDSTGAVTDVGTSGAAPGYEYDFAQATSPVTITATTEAGADTVVGGASVAYDGSTIVEIVFSCPYIQGSANSQYWVDLYDGASSIGFLGIFLDQHASGSVYAPQVLRRRLTPSNASHTYSVKAHKTAGGTVIIGAGAGGSGNHVPAFMTIRKV